MSERQLHEPTTVAEVTGYHNPAWAARYADLPPVPRATPEIGRAPLPFSTLRTEKQRKTLKDETR